MSKREAYVSQLTRRYQESHPKSMKMHQEACKYMPGGDTRTATHFEPFPHFIVEAEGAYMTDADGNRLLDFQNNYTSLIHGHAHGPTAEAVCAQMKKGTAYASPTPAQMELAKILTSRIPTLDLVRFTNSGTEANMHALRIARAYTKRAKIVKTEGGYHGTTDVFEASVDPNIKKAGSLDKIKVLPESRGVSANALKDVLVTPFNHIEETRKVIEENHKDIACFIVEPVMGSAGQILPEPEYLAFLRDITRQYGILLVFDEVVTLRLAMGGAQELYKAEPDLTSLGKIIGGGIPIGGFGGREEIMRMYDPREKKMYHSGTFNGNAVSMAAGCAAMADFTPDKLEHINALGSRFKAGLLAAFERLGLVIQVNGTGSLYNLIFSNGKIRNYRDVAASHEDLNQLLFMDLLCRGVFDAPRGMFCMSTAMTNDDIDFAVKTVEAALSDMKDTIKETAPELVVG